MLSLPNAFLLCSPLLSQRHRGPQPPTSLTNELCTPLACHISFSKPLCQTTPRLLNSCSLQSCGAGAAAHTQTLAAVLAKLGSPPPFGVPQTPQEALSAALQGCPLAALQAALLP